MIKPTPTKRSYQGQQQWFWLKPSQMISCNIKRKRNQPVQPEGVRIHHVMRWFLWRH